MLTDEQRQMVEGCMKMAASIAWKYVKRTPYEFDELYSICCEAMVKAATTFNPNKQAKYSTYAYKAIQFSILHRLRDDKYFKGECYLEDIVNKPTYFMPSIEETVTRRELVTNTLRLFRGTEREKAAATIFVRDPYLWQEEIAELVGVSQKTVSTAIRKLRKQLQMELAG